MDDSAVRSALRSQYHAALAMLRECIERCPETLWYDAAPTNAFWQVAYHTVYFTHLYLHEKSEDFQAWPEHQANVQYDDAIIGPPDPLNSLPLGPNPYTPAQVLAYLNICDAFVDRAVAALNLNATDCGFSWYKLSKFEHQLVNLRHAQHGAAQLADRLRAAAGIGIRWVGSRNQI